MTIIPIPLLIPITKTDRSVPESVARLMLMIAPHQPQPQYCIMGHNHWSDRTSVLTPCPDYNRMFATFEAAVQYAVHNKVLDDLEGKFRKQIEKSYETPDVHPTHFYAAVPLHGKNKSHFIRLCVDGVIARNLGYDNRRVPEWTWECETEVKKRNTYEMRPDMSEQDATIVGWELVVTIKKKETEKKKTRRTTPQHELPQYLRTDYGADGGY